MPFSPTVAAVLSRWPILQIEDALQTAVTVYLNGGEETRSYEGSSLTINLGNAEKIIETAEEALRLKRSKTQGCDGELEAPNRSVSLDRSFHRIR